MQKMNKIKRLYYKLLQQYGTQQSWWPIIWNSDKTFEIAIGSILTQNTTFISVIKSLNNLKELNLITPQNILNIDIDILKTAIKPSGFLNQKANYIINFTNFYIKLNGKIPTRDELLKIKGVGEETADSILLFGYNQPSMKVDAYTKRIFLQYGLINQNAKYKDIKALIENNLTTNYKIYQEFHALLVEHGKTLSKKIV